MRFENNVLFVTGGAAGLGARDRTAVRGRRRQVVVAYSELCPDCKFAKIDIPLTALGKDARHWAGVPVENTEPDLWLVDKENIPKTTEPAFSRSRTIRSSGPSCGASRAEPVRSGAARAAPEFLELSRTC